MNDWDRCPYCLQKISINDVYNTTDGFKDEGFATCPRCEKAFVHYTDVTVYFRINDVEGTLQVANKCVELFGTDRYKRRQAFLEKIVEYNKKIDDAVLSREEIEAYSDEWSGGYERME